MIFSFEVVLHRNEAIGFFKVKKPLKPTLNSR